MSRIENITVKIKHAKVKKIEKICSYFSQDYTAIHTAQELGISRQTVNQYYKILRDKLSKEFIFSDSIILDELLKTKVLHIKHLHIYNQDIFYLSHEDKILVLDHTQDLHTKLNEFIQNSLKNPLSKHIKANCARVLINQDKQSFLISGYLREDNNSFEQFLLKRLKQFRGVSKEKIFSYLKESQIRYNFSSSTIYERIVLSFK